MSQSGWTFFSNHCHVLVCIARAPDVRVRDIAAQVGITERAVMRIIGELEEAGFIEHTRIGRRNHYTIDLDRELRHELEGGVPIRAILKQFVDSRSLRRVSRTAVDCPE
jgi:DNA-binding IclR family transcriptional regulator